MHILVLQSLNAYHTF